MLPERFSPTQLPAVPGIYFLCKNAKIVYIGKTIHIAQRVASHIGIKDFDTVLVLRVPEELLASAEIYWIKHWKPPLNRAMGRPPAGKVLVGFKLLPETNKLLYRAAKKEGITKSEFVERAIQERLDKCQVNQ